MCEWLGRLLHVAVHDIGVSVPGGNGGVLDTIGSTFARRITYVASAVNTTLCLRPAVCLTDMSVSRICGAMTAVVFMRWCRMVMEMGPVWAIGL